MRTAPQRAALDAPTAPELYAALELKPVPDPEPAAVRHRGRRWKLLGKHEPRHAADDGEQAAAEFRSIGRPAPGRPRFTPRTGPQPAARPAPRHRAAETDRILAIAKRRADSVPVPARENPVTAAQALRHVSRLDDLRYPAYDAADGYGTIPAYVALMQRVSRITGTSSRFEFPGAWPLPVAPQVPEHRYAVTAGTGALEGHACPSRNPDTGEGCVHALAVHDERPHIGLSGGEWGGPYVPGHLHETPGSAA